MGLRVCALPGCVRAACVRQGVKKGQCAVSDWGGMCGLGAIGQQGVPKRVTQQRWGTQRFCRPSISSADMPSSFSQRPLEVAFTHIQRLLQGFISLGPSQPPSCRSPSAMARGREGSDVCVPRKAGCHHYLTSASDHKGSPFISPDEARHTYICVTEKQQQLACARQQRAKQQQHKVMVMTEERST